MVFQRQGIILLFEGEVVGNAAGPSPDCVHDILSTFGKPGALKIGIIAQHTQRSYLQQDEDSCIDQDWYEIAFVQNFIS